MQTARVTFFVQKCLMPVLTITCYGFGLVLTCFLLWSKFTHSPLPCPVGVCEALNHDPSSHPFGVPLPAWGATTYALILGLFIRSLSSSGKASLRMAVDALGAASAIVSLYLLLRAWQISGAMCPWCCASAAASLFGLGFLLLTERSETNESPRLVWVALPSIPISLMAAFAIIHLMLRSERTADNLEAIPVSRLISATSLIKDGATVADGRGLVLFVDLGCGTCRVALNQILRLPSQESVFVHFVHPESVYSEQAALLLLDARPTQRAIAMSSLLGDDSRTLSTIRSTRGRLGLPLEPTLRSANELQIDASLSQQLRITATPILIKVEDDRKTLIDIQDLPHFVQSRGSREQL